MIVVVSHISLDLCLHHAMIWSERERASAGVRARAAALGRGRVSFMKIKFQPEGIFPREAQKWCCIQSTRSAALTKAMER